MLRGGGIVPGEGRRACHRGWARSGRALAGLLAAGLLAVPAAARAQPACPPPTGQEATTRPEVRRGHEIRFRDRLDRIAEALHRERFDVIMLGDSLVQFWPDALAAQAFPGRRVLNAGVAGDGAAALLHRLDSRPTEAVVEGRRVTLGVSGWERQSPGTVMILLGTNDLRRGTPCDVAAGLKAVTERARRIWPRADILLLSLLPRGVDQRELAGEIAAINALLAAGAGAGAARYRFADVHAALLCQEPGCQLRRPPNFVHLTEEGYGRLVAALRMNSRTTPR
jgi:lysophospholipase L1-like esterase